jgi:hypothetical protein
MDDNIYSPAISFANEIYGVVESVRNADDNLTIVKVATLYGVQELFCTLLKAPEKLLYGVRMAHLPFFFLRREKARLFMRTRYYI